PPRDRDFVVEGSTMTNRRNRLRRAALVLALLVLAVIVTGVAASATNTVIPKRLTGSWGRQNAWWMVVSTEGKVKIDAGAVYHAKFSRVTAHRLTVSGVPSCSGTGTYRWTITKDMFSGSDLLKLTKIHDACKPRVNMFTHQSW